jgi:hypothetical protein
MLRFERQVIGWDRGRPARSERGARNVCATTNHLTSEARERLMALAQGRFQKA